MKLIRTILLMFFISGITGCSKWLDVSPKTEIKADVLFSKQAGFRDALIGIYSLMTMPPSYGTEMSIAFVDVLAQNYDNVRGSINHNYLNAANYRYTESSEESRILGIWRQQFKAISNANILLKNIDLHQDVFTGKNYNLIKGETLGLRAFLHFDMLRLFAPSPVTGKDRKAIPYVDSYTNSPFPQLSTEQVLEKITDDLIAARELLKDADPYGPMHADLSGSQNEIAGNRNSRMNYYAATATLARVQLYRNNKADALTYANEVINSTLFPLFVLRTTAPATTKGDYVFPTEQVFSLVIPGLKTKYADFYFPEVSDAQNVIALTLNNTSITNIYAAGVNTDYRNNWFETSTATGKRVSKYTYNTIIPLIKVSEMLLIAAEAEAQVTPAIAYLNLMRAHRGLSPLDATSFTRETLNTEIGNEYRREFIAEGQLFYYYKRMNVEKLPTIPAFTNRESVYNLPIPVSEKEFGNIE